MIIYKIVELLLICCFEVMMLDSFSRTLLSIRRKQGKFYLPVVMLLTVCALISVNSYDNSLVNLFLVPLIYCIYIIIIYLESVFKCVCSAICFYMLAMTPEFMISIVFSLSSYYDIGKILENEWSRLCLTLVAKIITFIVVKCVEQIYRKKDYEEVRNGIFCSLLVLPLATMILLSGLFYADIHIPQKNKLFLELGTGMLLFANAFMFYLFDKLVIAMAKANKIERLYMKSETENKHYHEVERINDNHRVLMHDIKKYIRTAVQLIQVENNVEALRIFEKLDIQIKNTSQINYCRNKILNAILCERKRKADELGLKYHVSLSEDLYVDYIEDIDLISIVGNLIDNGIEASSKLSRGGFVNIEMFMANEGYFMVWEVRNNFLIPPVLGKKGFITSKHDEKEHGIGIHTVEKIVKSYDGNLKIDIDNGEFNVSIIYQIDRGGPWCGIKKVDNLFSRIS